MIITRTPFRVSFAGGGSDVAWFYKKNGMGSVLSSTIKQYMYIVIHPYFHKNFHHQKIRLKYSKVEDISDVNDIKHPIVRECLKRLDLPGGMEIASFADIPSGTGLGSSSSFAVGLLHGLYAWKGITVSKEQLAREACEIEIDILGSPIGKQDQYAVAYGGLNVITFYKDETVSVAPVCLTNQKKKRMEAGFRLYYMGSTRKADDILGRQNSQIDMEKKFSTIKQMLMYVDKMKNCLEQGTEYLAGTVFDKCWEMKKSLDAKISNIEIDTIYDKAKRIGASGGKLLGAGGTGFLLLESDDHDSLKKKLGLVSFPYKMDRDGSKVIFFD